MTDQTDCATAPRASAPHRIRGASAARRAAPRACCAGPATWPASCRSPSTCVLGLVLPTVAIADRRLPGLGHRQVHAQQHRRRDPRHLPDGLRRRASSCRCSPRSSPASSASSSPTRSTPPSAALCCAGWRSPPQACSPTSAAFRWRSCSSPRSAPPAWSPVADRPRLRHRTTTASDLFTVGGVPLVYMYFQIPLMVLVILPALEGLRPAWREAAENLGASSWQYWRLHRRPGAGAVVPGLRAAAVRQRVLRLCHGRGLTSGTHPADGDPDRLVPERQRARGPAERRQGARPRHGGHHRDRHDHLRSAAAEGGTMAAIADADVGLASARALGRARRRRRRSPPSGAGSSWSWPGCTS